MEKLDGNVKRDELGIGRLKLFEDRLETLEAVDHQQKMQFNWLLQEYRVSVFAQNLGTIVPISEKRLEKAWQALTDNRR
jgi:ATP-dependent helicase HrpA